MHERTNGGPDEKIQMYTGYKGTKDILHFFKKIKKRLNEGKDPRLNEKVNP